MAATVLNCLFQLFWFGTKCLHQIGIDGMDYIGIARHLRDHQFYSAINAFRSPLLSWMIAAASFFDGDFVRIGKFLNIGSFLLCVVLLYVFTQSLWHSRLAASLAAFLFSLARGLLAVAVEIVTPDFLLAALVLLYFIVLLNCLRAGKPKYWVWLGAIHALAFLAKGFALPWLALCTVLAVLLSIPRKRYTARLALAGILPVLVATAWTGVLHSKYGAFTTGTQFKVNFLQWTLHAYSNRPNETYTVLRNTKPFIDENNVNDPMPPGSWPWHYRIDTHDAARGLLSNEIHNLPKAAKELFIVVSPGGLLAFAYVLVVLVRRRNHARVKFVMGTVIALGSFSLLLADCMLVFDGRYLDPIIPLLLAIAVGFFLEGTGPVGHLGRNTVMALIVAGVIVSVLYPASPFRTLRRDFQILCYRTGGILRTHPGSTVVSLGSGPFPEHGVGWEAGYKSAYFGDRRLIGATDQLPDLDSIAPTLRDISLAAPDAVLVWGRPGNPRYDAFLQQFVHNPAPGSQQVIADPALGQVGIAIFLPQH
jgi:hypothetical protein